MAEEIVTVGGHIPPNIPSPFKLIHANDDLGVRMELLIELPGDGTPTLNQLIVRVDMEREDSNEAALSVVSRTGPTHPQYAKRDYVLTMQTVPVEKLANMLHKFARLETKRYLRIISE